VSATTRTPRPGEQHGEHYFFVDDEQFDRMLAHDEMLEWATVHNAHRYGTPRGPVLEAAGRGDLVLLEIDLQGARQVRANMPDARLVFLAPPSWDELVDRLVGRGTEGPEERARRLETAKVELAAADEFDEVIVNDEVPLAAMRLVELMRGDLD
jgi:guanylate kinase